MRPLDPRLRPYLHPARREIAALVGGSVAGGVLLIMQAVALATTVARLVADPAGGGWHTPALLFAAALTVRALLGVLIDRASARAADRVGAGLRARVLRAALRDAGPAGRGGAGSDQALLATRGVRAVEPYLTRYLPALVLAGVLPALTVVAIGWLDLWSALVVVLTLPLVPVFAILIGLTTRERADRQWRVLGQLAGHFVDVVRGLPTLVAHRRAGAQAPVIRAVTDRYRRANTDVLRLAFSSSAALELIATISVALVAVLVGLRLAGGGLELEVALAVLLLAPEAYWPLRRVGAEFHAAAEGTATFEAILALEQDDVADRDDAAREPLPPGDLVVTGVRLRHPGAPGPVVDGLDLRAPARGLTVLSGPSGCGKTTLLEAIAGAMPLEAGTIALEPAIGLDGDLGSERWRRSVAISTQRPWLVEGSVADNLRIGAPDAGDAELWAALREVELAEVVAHSPGGLDAALGEDGAGLSAGQHARLALARVLLSDRPIVLLDEPTAHLDAATEAIVLRVLRGLAEQRCVIAVAHRAALLEAADVVVRLDAAAAVPGPSRSLGDPSVSSARGERPAPVSAPSDAEPVTGRGGARARWALATLLGTASSLCGVALTATAGWLIVRASEQPPVLMLMVAIVGVRAFGLGRPALRYAERLVSHDVALRELAERRARIYDVLVPLVPARLGGTDGRRRGELMTALVDDVDSLLDERLRVRMPLVACVGVLAVASAVTIPLLPGAAAATLALAALSALAAWSTAQIATRRRARAEIDARAELGTAALAVLDDADQLRAWGSAEPAIARVDAAGDRLGRTATAMADAVAWARCWPQLAAAAGVLAVAALGAGPLADGAVSGPVLALLLLLPLALAEVVAPLADAGALRVRTRAAAERIDSLARLAPAVVDPALAAATPSAPIDVDLVAARARWDDDAREVGPFDVTLAPGARLGVVGPSGSGKSTLAALLVRFLAPSAGEHRLGGTPVERLTGDQVRSLIGMVDDDPYLFASSVAENLRLARPGCSDAEIVRALRRVRLDDWLAALPEGLGTRIGDGGRSVSGGERARLGLARALLADTPVLVLDEPTAHLDTTTARAVADDLLSAARGRSVVWISHDRVGLEQVDAVLDLGERPRRESLVPTGC